MSDNFEFALSQTLHFEGGYSNDPDDRGGETNYGITHFDVDRAYRKGVISHNNTANLTVDEAKSIYRDFYWDVSKLDLIQNKHIAAEMFDTSVNMGPTQMGKIVQRALEYLGENLAVDGVVGPITRSLINKWCNYDPKSLFIVMNCEQYAIYKIIIENNPSQLKFARGWLKRIQQWVGDI